MHMTLRDFILESAPEGISDEIIEKVKRFVVRRVLQIFRGKKGLWFTRGNRRFFVEQSKLTPQGVASIIRSKAGVFSGNVTELSKLTGFTNTKIRKLSSGGFIPSPVRTTLRNPKTQTIMGRTGEWSQIHVDALDRIKDLFKRGIPLNAIGGKLTPVEKQKLIRILTRPGRKATDPPGFVGNIKVLAKETGATLRQIKQFSDERILFPPSGIGKSPFYIQRHFDRIKRIQELVRLGFSVPAIRRLRIIDLPDEFLPTP